jgi:hypothetical protein
LTAKSGVPAELDLDSVPAVARLSDCLNAEAKSPPDMSIFTGVAEPNGAAIGFQRLRKGSDDVRMCNSDALVHNSNNASVQATPGAYDRSTESVRAAADRAQTNSQHKFCPSQIAAFHLGSISARKCGTDKMTQIFGISRLYDFFHAP